MKIGADDNRRYVLKKSGYLISVCTLCLLVILAGQARSASDQKTQDDDAWRALKSGNAIILMRHAIAPGVGDPAEFDIEKCSTQRNLSEAGRMQARAIGNVLRANGIAKAEVLSSQWCRCMETASLLDLGEPAPSAMLNSFFQNRQAEPEQTRTLKQSLDQWLPYKGDAKVLVTHQVNISSLTGQFSGSGDMLIVTLENGVPMVLATISTN